MGQSTQSGWRAKQLQYVANPGGLKQLRDVRRRNVIGEKSPSPSVRTARAPSFVNPCDLERQRNWFAVDGLDSPLRDRLWKQICISRWDLVGITEGTFELTCRWTSVRLSCWSFTADAFLCRRISTDGFSLYMHMHISRYIYIYIYWRRSPPECP